MISSYLRGCVCVCVAAAVVARYFDGRHCVLANFYFFIFEFFVSRMPSIPLTRARAPSRRRRCLFLELFRQQPGSSHARAHFVYGHLSNCSFIAYPVHNNSGRPHFYRIRAPPHTPHHFNPPPSLTRTYVGFKPPHKPTSDEPTV